MPGVSAAARAQEIGRCDRWRARLRAGRVRGDGTEAAQLAGQVARQARWQVGEADGGRICTVDQAYTAIDTQSTLVQKPAVEAARYGFHMATRMSRRSSALDIAAGGWYAPPGVDLAAFSARGVVLHVTNFPQSNIVG